MNGLPRRVCTIVAKDGVLLQEEYFDKWGKNSMVTLHKSNAELRFSPFRFLSVPLARHSLPSSLGEL